MGPFTLRNQVTKEEYEVPFTVISESSAEAGTQPKEEPPWIHGAVSFGGWDWVSLGVLMAALLAVLLVSGRIAWKRLQKHLSRNFTYTERALHDLANLQKYMRSQKPLPLEEWKKFSFELAGILRKYSDRNFQLNSVDMTDREFLEELHGHREATSQVRLLADILGTITEVRYGRKALDASVIPGLLLDSKKFVESTSREKKEESRK